MRDSLLLLAVVVGSYLAAHVIFERFAKRFALVSGAEYLVLGVVLGPQATGVLTPDTIESFQPLITLGLGWIGALVGARFVLSVLVRTPAIRYRIAISEAAVTMVATGGCAYLVGARLVGLPDEIALLVAAGLALTSLPASSAGLEVVEQGTAARDPVVRQVSVSTQMLAGIASAGLALLFALVHDSPTSLPRRLVPTEWFVVTIAIGLVGGLLFHLFVGDERKADRVFVSLAGVIVLVSGAASSLRLSPVFAAMVFGVILGNSRTNRTVMLTALARVERPFYFALLIFAGALWEVPAPAALPIAAAVLLVRPLARVGGGGLAARANAAVDELGPGWGRALIGHGGFALILAMDYLLQGTLPEGGLVFATVVGSMILTDVGSVRVLQSVRVFR
ncbi:MAG: hypothetical protein SFW08_11250 [Gemmatimonadaceae bacterium]|nr:hypothetical protein [Gemmatimonadaceae bacterium]